MVDGSWFMVDGNDPIDPALSPTRPYAHTPIRFDDGTRMSGDDADSPSTINHEPSTTPSDGFAPVMPSQLPRSQGTGDAALPAEAALLPTASRLSPLDLLFEDESDSGADSLDRLAYGVATWGAEEGADDFGFQVSDFRVETAIESSSSPTHTYSHTPTQPLPSLIAEDSPIIVWDTPPARAQLGTMTVAPLSAEGIADIISRYGAPWEADGGGDSSTTQVVYLDFDGAENVDYAGPVSAADVDVPAFSLERFGLAGQEQQVVEAAVARLNELLSGENVQVVTERPASGTYSTVYVGGAGDAFADHGSLFGVTEQVDAGN
ncbi:MAG: hypothetical protein FJ279_21895, partial [Planctomycetes bacterium]|nr:hypothetical protein [Planctomycetota bacterium]